MVHAGGVVHAVRRGTDSLVCEGRYAASQVEAVFEPRVVTCLWCVTGVQSGLRWFKWGDGT